MSFLTLVTASLMLIVGTSAEQGYFWFVNDIHYDPTYETSQQSCNDQIPQENLGKYGNYECDAPWALVKASLEAAKNVGPSPDFIMWAGDNPYHAKNKSYLSVDKVLELTQNVTDLFKTIFPGVQVYPTLGNHDYFPTSQLPAEPSFIYGEVAKMWADWINKTEDAMQSFRKFASYELTMKEGYKLIELNTNIYYKSDQVTRDKADPGEQFAWFTEKLAGARVSNEKVHILTHIPSGVVGSQPGTFWFNEHHNIRFNEIIREYSNVILALYGVHQHTDTFHIFYKKEKPVASQIIVPSVTPWRSRLSPTTRGEARNPAIRKFLYNRDNMALTGFEQYYLSLPNATEEGIPTWKLLYTSKDAYGLDDLQAQSMHNLVVNSFEKPGNALFSEYHRYNTVNAKHFSNALCSTECKKAHICSIKHVDYSFYNQCRGPAFSRATILREIVSDCWQLSLAILVLTLQFSK